MYFDVLGIFLSIGFSFFGNRKHSETQQLAHIQMIISTNEVDPFRSDFYYGSHMETMFNYELCPLLDSYVRRTHERKPTDPIYKVPSHMICHNFTKTELAHLNNEYMKNVYTPKNCPCTYRNKNVFVNINNETANKLYYDYCKDHFRGEHSDIIPYFFCTGMIITVFLHAFSLVFKGEKID